MKDGSYGVLVLRLSDGRLRIGDPLTRTARDESADAVAAAWDGEIILVTRRWGGAGLDPSTFGFRWVLPSLWRYRSPLANVLIASLFVQLFALATPIFFQLVVDKVLVHKGMSTLVVLVVGMVALGLFADGTYGSGWNGVSGNVTGLFYGDAGQFAAQLVSVAVCFAWGFGFTSIVFGIYKMFTSMRVSPEAEIMGLDVPEFGVPGYAGFVMERELHGSIPAELLERAGLATSPISAPRVAPAPLGGGGS